MLYLIVKSYFSASEILYYHFFSITLISYNFLANWK